jgi:hypothetical protein
MVITNEWILFPKTYKRWIIFFLQSIRISMKFFSQRRVDNQPVGCSSSRAALLLLKARGQHISCTGSWVSDEVKVVAISNSGQSGGWLEWQEAIWWMKAGEGNDRKLRGLVNCDMVVREQSCQQRRDEPPPVGCGPNAKRRWKGNGPKHFL